MSPGVSARLFCPQAARGRKPSSSQAGWSLAGPQDTSLLAQGEVTLLGEGAVASRAADGRSSHGCDR